MKYHIGDKLILCEIECTVGFIDGDNRAYLFPDHDGDTYDKGSTYIGCAFATIDSKGRDKLGNKAMTIINQDCGAV